MISDVRLVLLESWRETQEHQTTFSYAVLLQKHLDWSLDLVDLHRGYQAWILHPPAACLRHSVTAGETSSAEREQ